MLNDVIANLLSAIKNAEKAGKSELNFKPTSSLATRVMMIMKEEGYLSDFESVEDGKGGLYIIKLSKKLNNCGVVKPRFPVRKDDFVKWERRFLPAEGFGVLVVSTSQGIMTHHDAKKKGIGGKLLAYVY